MSTGKRHSSVSKRWRWIKAISLVIYKHLLEELLERRDKTIEEDLVVTIEEDLVEAIARDPIEYNDRFRPRQAT